MSLLEYDLNEIKKEMWEMHLINTPQSLTYCDWCYDRSDTTCKCAERRFYNRLTNERIQKYIKERRKMELEYIKEQLELKKSEVKEFEQILKQYS